jgi:hypothetical protein
LSGLEPLLLEFVRKSAGTSTNRELIELFKEMKEKLILSKDAMKDYAFNYTGWIESKILGKRFSEVVQKGFASGRETRNVSQFRQSPLER